MARVENAETDDFYRHRVLPDGRTVTIYIQLFNVMLQIYPAGQLLWWSEGY